jgi:hypothetical protein
MRNVLMGFFKMLVSAAAFALIGSAAMATTVPDSPPYDLLVTATGAGAFEGQTASGAVFWNQSLLGGVGFESMSRSGIFGSTIDATLGLFFDVGPGDYTFTEADDDLGPIFMFLDGILQNIDYIVSDSYSAADMASAGVAQFSFDTRTPVSFDGTTIYVNAIVKYLETGTVPLPAGLPLLGGALGLLAFARRRRTFAALNAQ